MFQSPIQVAQLTESIITTLPYSMHAGRLAAKFFAELAAHQQDTDTLRQIAACRCSTTEEVLELLGVEQGGRIDKHAILQFIAKESQTAAASIVGWVDVFLRQYSRSATEGFMDADGLEEFLRLDSSVVLMGEDEKSENRSELRYALFLLFVQEIEHCKASQLALGKMEQDYRAVLQLLFEGLFEPLTSQTVAQICSRYGEEGGPVRAQSAWKRLLRISCLGEQKADITIKQFNYLMRNAATLGRSNASYGKPLGASVEYTPVRQLKQSDLRSSDRSTGLISDEKKTLKLQLQDVGRQVKKRLVFDAMSEVILKKVLAFIIAACRRDKEINAAKSELFSTHKVNLFRLFELLDKTRSEFVTSRQLQDLLGEVSTLVVYFYGHEGVVRFCDFAKLLVPLSTTLEDIEGQLAADLTPETFGKVETILSKMAAAELSNLKDIRKLVHEFKVAQPAQMLSETLFKETSRLNAAELAQLFEKNFMPISEIELTLAFRKYDRDYDGYITLEDFSPYLL